MKPSLLIDIDGVFRIGEDKLIEGSIEALDYLKKNKIKHLFLTNGTRACRETIAKQLQNIGLDIKESEIFTAPLATIDYIKSQKKDPKIFLIGEGDTYKDFEKRGIEIVKNEQDVDYVVIGFDRTLDHKKLTIAHRLLIKESELIAINADKQFKAEDGFYPGPKLTIAGLEASTGKKAIVIGKPQKLFFEEALKELGSKKDETFIIGDSIESDINGGKNIGLKTILVKTGVFNENELRNSKLNPDYILNSIKDLPDLIERL